MNNLSRLSYLRRELAKIAEDLPQLYKILGMIHDIEKKLSRNAVRVEPLDLVQEEKKEKGAESDPLLAQKEMDIQEEEENQEKEEEEEEKQEKEEEEEEKEKLEQKKRSADSMSVSVEEKVEQKNKKQLVEDFLPYPRQCRHCKNFNMKDARSKKHEKSCGKKKLSNASKSNENGPPPVIHQKPTTLAVQCNVGKGKGGKTLHSLAQAYCSDSESSSEEDSESSGDGWEQDRLDEDAHSQAEIDGEQEESPPSAPVEIKTYIGPNGSLEYITQV